MINKPVGKINALVDPIATYEHLNYLSGKVNNAIVALQPVYDAIKQIGNRKPTEKDVGTLEHI